MNSIKPDELLYTDEAGNLVGLDEVQLLDEIPTSRIEALRDLLYSQEYAFEAMLVLAAWGDPEGMAYAERAIESTKCDDSSIYIHRIYGYDNSLDEIAGAVKISMLNGIAYEKAVQLYRKLLRRYGECRFEGKLKSALLACGDELLEDVESAMERAMTSGFPYLASQLLPVLARWRPNRVFEAWKTIESSKLASEGADPKYNLIESLRYVPGQASRDRLNELAQDKNVGLANAAKEALKVQDG